MWNLFCSVYGQKVAKVYVCVCVCVHAFMRMNMIIYIYIYIISLPRSGCDTRSISSELKLVWIQSFLSLRLVVNLSVCLSVCLALYIYIYILLLYGCTTWAQTKRLKKKLDGNYTRMLRAILNKSWRQHPTRHQLYGHLPPITKTIQVRRTRHTGHSWRSKDELISYVLWWTRIWPSKSRTTCSNIHTAAMWGYGMYPWRPARSDEW